MQIANSLASTSLITPRVESGRKAGDTAMVAEKTGASAVETTTANLSLAEPTPQHAEPKFPYYDGLGRPRDFEGRLCDQDGRPVASQAVETTGQQPPDNFWEGQREHVRLYETNHWTREGAIETNKRDQEFEEYLERVIKPYVEAKQKGEPWVQQMLDGKLTEEAPKTVEWLKQTVSVYNACKQRTTNDQYRTDPVYKASVDHWLAHSRSLVTNAYQGIVGPTQASGPVLMWNADGTLSIPSFSLSLNGRTILTHQANASA